MDDAGSSFSAKLARRSRQVDEVQVNLAQQHRLLIAAQQAAEAKASSQAALNAAGSLLQCAEHDAPMQTSSQPPVPPVSNLSRFAAAEAEAPGRPSSDKPASNGLHLAEISKAQAEALRLSSAHPPPSTVSDPSQPAGNGAQALRQGTALPARPATSGPMPNPAAPATHHLIRAPVAGEPPCSAVAPAAANQLAAASEDPHVSAHATPYNGVMPTPSQRIQAEQPGSKGLGSSAALRDPEPTVQEQPPRRTKRSRFDIGPPSLQPHNPSASNGVHPMPASSHTLAASRLEEDVVASTSQAAPQIPAAMDPTHGPALPRHMAGPNLGALRPAGGVMRPLRASPPIVPLLSHAGLPPPVQLPSSVLPPRPPSRAVSHAQVSSLA